MADQRSALLENHDSHNPLTQHFVRFGHFITLATFPSKHQLRLRVQC